MATIHLMIILINSSVYASLTSHVLYNVGKSNRFSTKVYQLYRDLFSFRRQRNRIEINYKHPNLLNYSVIRRYYQYPCCCWDISTNTFYCSPFNNYLSWFMINELVDFYFALLLLPTFDKTRSKIELRYSATVSMKKVFLMLC